MQASEVHFANPASVQHRAGQYSAELVEQARASVGAALGRSSRDIIFTSGATEAATIAVVGATLGEGSRPNVVVAATEHKALIAAAELGALASGGEVRTVRVHGDGTVDLAHLDALVDSSVSVVAVMAANNETGVLAPLSEVAAIAHRHGALFLSDATQLVGKEPLGSGANEPDLLLLSSHKIYGPKGAGALVASRHVQRRLKPVFGGGGQERGLRGGTHNTQSIVGFGRASELAASEVTDDSSRIRLLKARLLTTLTNEISDIQVNSRQASTLSNTLNIRFPGADTEAVMSSAPHIAISAGSACQSAVPMPSHVLLAMGLSHRAATESMRISLGRPTTANDIDEAALDLVSAVLRVRKFTSETRG